MEDKILHQKDVSEVIDARIATALAALPADMDLTEVQIRAIVQDELANVDVGLTEAEVRAIVQDEIANPGGGGTDITGTVVFEGDATALEDAWWSTDNIHVVQDNHYRLGIRFESADPPPAGFYNWGPWMSGEIFDGLDGSDPPADWVDGSIWNSTFWHLESTDSAKGYTTLVLEFVAGTDDDIQFAIDNTHGSGVPITVSGVKVTLDTI